MTTQELFISALYTFAQKPDNERFVTDFYGSINESQDEFANKRLWGCFRKSGTVTTEASTRTASLPTDFGSFFPGRGSIRLSDGTTIKLITADQYWSELYDSDEEGEPAYCWIEEGTLNFSPVPDDEYTVSIVYYKRPTVVANAKTDLTMPVRYHELLKKLVFRRLQILGYSALQELAVSDSDTERLYGMAAKDDIAEYGGLVMNLPSKTYTIETV